ncbi:hypothetical protein [Shewanella sp. GXUN23E]|uniref:hypothetical protein n=1 Tax=Shewanella sp. GXUN23E TaxID=3422498 RepID=UPI003D7EF499
MSLCLLWGVGSGNVNADAGVGFSGFGNLGVIHNDSRNLKFHRDYTMDGVPQGWSANADSLLGLQLDAQLNDRFDALIQVVLKDRVSHQLSDTVEWGFIRYRPDDNWAIRVGRLGLDLYMLSEYRDVSYAYLWARPVPEFYSLISSISKYDGADISYRRHAGDYLLEAKLAYGTNKADLAGADQDITIKLNQVYALTLSMSSAEWLWRVAVAMADTTGMSEPSSELIYALEQVPSQLWPEAAGLAGEIRFENRDAVYYAAGVQYDNGDWLVQSELGYTDTNWDMLMPYVSGYLSVGRRIEDFTFYAVYAGVHQTQDVPHVPPPQISPFLPEQAQLELQQLYQGVNYTFMASRLEQRSWSLGLRWDFAQDVALKVQWDNVSIMQPGSSLWVRDNALSHDDQVQLFSINLSFTF